MNREELIKRIKYCGESIINNAEKIAAGYEYNTGLTITCNPYDESSSPVINVDIDFIPEGFINERLD